MNGQLKIGSIIWRFDENRRVYTHPTTLGGGRLIYREHWRPVEVVGETSRSWDTGWAGKVPKKGPHPGWAFTEQEVEDNCWVHDHRCGISSTVNRCKDAATLRQVAAVIGYTP